MSTIDCVRFDACAERTRAAFVRLHDVVFGDRVGSVLFCGALLFFLSYWRIGIFVSDTYTIANTLVAVADGHLHIARIVYGPSSGTTPGMHVADGRLYGRNYGLVFFALPFLWVIEGVTTVADPRVAISALWSLLALEVCLRLGSILGSERAFALLGSSVALASLAGNVAVATPLDPRWFPLVALQVSTMVAAALVGVLVYRLLARVYDRQVGVVGGSVTVLATPVGFWASLPKRHALTALLVLCVCYCVYRSRSAATARAACPFRALAYAWVGASAWVNAMEALVLFVALVAVDLPTARSNDRRTLGVLVGAFCLSLVPFVLTNVAITGNPLTPPHLLESYTAEGQLATSGETVASGGARTGWSVTGLIGTAVARVEYLSLVYEGAFLAVSEPDRLVRTFVRSGYIERIAEKDGHEAINLTVLESMPVAGALLALPAILVCRWRRGRTAVRSLRRRVKHPARVLDALAIGYATGLTFVYFPWLPNYAMVTVRWLLPVFPLAVYGALRLRVLRRAVTTRWKATCWTYAIMVLIGGQLLLAAVALTDATLGEASQLHAWIGLLAGLALGGTTTIAVVRRGRSTDRGLAISFGLAAGVGTVFVLLSGLVYFSSTGDFALPVVERLLDAVSIPVVHEVGS